MQLALRYATKFGATDSAADRKRLEAEEMWEKLAALRKDRRGETSVVHALAVCNTAVLIAIRGRANRSALQLEEAFEKSREASRLAEVALEDRVRAQAACTKASWVEYAAKMLAWDRRFAKEAAAAADSDAKRVRKMDLLAQEAYKVQNEDYKDDDRERQKKDRLTTVERAIANLRRERFGALEIIKKGPPEPPRPLVEADRHEDAMLVWGACLANELLIAEEVGPPLDETEDARRNANHAKCVGIYACASERGRSQLDNLNRRFARLRDEDEMMDDEPPSSSSSEDEAEVYGDERPESDGEIDDSPLENAWHEPHEEDDEVPRARAETFSVAAAFGRPRRYRRYTCWASAWSSRACSLLQTPRRSGTSWKRASSPYRPPGRKSRKRRYVSNRELSPSFSTLQKKRAQDGASPAAGPRGQAGGHRRKSERRKTPEEARVEDAKVTQGDVDGDELRRGAARAVGLGGPEKGRADPRPDRAREGHV